MKQFATKLWIALCDTFAAIKWPRLQAFINGGVYYKLTEADHDQIRQLMTDRYLVVMTRRKCHLTTYLISLASMFNGGGSYYTHTLMNVEGDINGHVGHVLVESIGVGVRYSTFMEVFDCDSVALLAPKGVSAEEWNTAMEYAKKQVGKGYDDFFDLSQQNTFSCVDLVWWAIKQLPDYEQRFPKLTAELNKPNAKLTPEMMYESGDMEIVFEVRR